MYFVGFWYFDLVMYLTDGKKWANLHTMYLLENFFTYLQSPFLAFDVPNWEILTDWDQVVGSNFDGKIQESFRFDWGKWGKQNASCTKG